MDLLIFSLRVAPSLKKGALLMVNSPDCSLMRLSMAAPNNSDEMLIGGNVGAWLVDGADVEGTDIGGTDDKGTDVEG